MRARGSVSEGECERYACFTDIASLKGLGGAWSEVRSMFRILGLDEWSEYNSSFMILLIGVVLR